MPKRTHCAERTKLLDEFVAVTTALYRAATKVRLATGAGFPTAFAALEAARKNCVDARGAFVSHRDLHGC